MNLALTDNVLSLVLYIQRYLVAYMIIMIIHIHILMEMFKTPKIAKKVEKSVITNFD